MMPAAPDRHAVQCLEVWGGNHPAATSVAVPGIDAWLHSTTYRGHAAGGDIHYVSNCAAGIITRFVLADVAGHGDAASTLALELRSLMRRNINTLDQTRMARALNRSFAELSADGRFATALLATYHAPSDHLVVCNAGHPHPLWFHASTGAWEVLRDNTPHAHSPGIKNLPLGVIDPTSYGQFAVRLDPGDMVVAYTDALIEASDFNGRQLGEAGLLEIVRGASRECPRSLAEGVLRAVAHYTGDADVADDATLLVLRHTGEDPPAMTLRERAKVTARMLGITR